MKKTSLLFASALIVCAFSVPARAQYIQTPTATSYYGAPPHSPYSNLVDNAQQRMYSSIGDPSSPLNQYEVQLQNYDLQVQTHDQQMGQQASSLEAEAQNLVHRTDAASRSRLMSIQNWLHDYENMKTVEQKNLSLMSQRVQAYRQQQIQFAQYNQEQSQVNDDEERQNAIRKDNERAFEARRDAVSQQKHEEFDKEYDAYYAPSSGTVSNVTNALEGGRP